MWKKLHNETEIYFFLIVRERVTNIHGRMSLGGNCTSIIELNGMGATLHGGITM